MSIDPRLDGIGDNLDRELAARAVAAAGHAYARYSRLRVGAALRTARGNLVSGCNVENASFGLTICAERSAVVAAVTLEGAAMRIRTIAVYASDAMAAPCGACRQVVGEFGPDARVLFHQGGGWSEVSLAELLPYEFRLDP